MGSLGSSAAPKGRSALIPRAVDIGGAAVGLLLDGDHLPGFGEGGQKLPEALYRHEGTVHRGGPLPWTS